MTFLAEDAFGLEKDQVFTGFEFDKDCGLR